MARNQIWVGNVPYDATEEDIYRIFSAVAPVVSAKIIYDKDTGQSKGFGFCTFEDPESCALAVSDLQGIILGDRALRLDFCSSDQRLRSLIQADSGRTGESLQDEVAKQIELDGTLTAVADRLNDARASITGVISNMGVPQLIHVMSAAQELVRKSPETARTVLTQNPALCYALLHAQLILGLADPAGYDNKFASETPGMNDPDLVQRRFEHMSHLYEKTADVLDRNYSVDYA